MSGRYDIAWRILAATGIKYSKSRYQDRNRVFYSEEVERCPLFDFVKQPKVLRSYTTVLNSTCGQARRTVIR
jgi:hypothetical protein